MVRLEVTETALTKLVAQAAVDIPGVARMAPTLGGLIKGAAVRAARQLTDTPGGEPAAVDASAVDVEDDPGEPLTVTVRIIASGLPPVRDTVVAVHAAVAAALVGAGHGAAAVTVLVVDVEP